MRGAVADGRAVAWWSAQCWARWREMQLIRCGARKQAGRRGSAIQIRLQIKCSVVKTEFGVPDTGWKIPRNIAVEVKPDS